MATNPDVVKAVKKTPKKPTKNPAGDDLAERSIRSLPARVLSGWENNGHVFEKDLTCRCGKTLTQHNEDPWACPITIALMAKHFDNVRRGVQTMMSRYRNILVDLVRTLPKEMQKHCFDLVEKGQ
jgi:hypothetical protein